ncbi:hypothetical protein EVAR_96509_1 [Eumeta japonica]|uniref:Uncharacterized protein n=1 Tax=Eumeta variegata TaxID=151549 RepID=A0A4C1WFC4_EUMVA|nr:hypothetical protein EVAR_96509_1 [Eumeta japonica]
MLSRRKVTSGANSLTCCRDTKRMVFVYSTVGKQPRRRVEGHRRPWTAAEAVTLRPYSSGNFDVKNEPGSGRPATDKVDAFLEKVEQDRHISSYDTAEELGINRKTV